MNYKLDSISFICHNLAELIDKVSKPIKERPASKDEKIDHLILLAYSQAIEADSFNSHLILLHHHVPQIAKSVIQNIANIKLMIIITVLLCLLTLSTQNRVIQITTSNVQLVLKTVDKMHLLLHSPSCPNSKEYASKFLEVKTPYNLGITDCEREKVLCNHLNITHFPTLIELTSNAMSIVDEQSFLVREGLISQDDPKAVLNRIVRNLKEEKKHVTVVLEEQGLPVIDRLNPASQRGIYYLQPASRLYKHISSMVGGKIGCWILSTKNSKLEKYYCGNGYKGQDIQKYLENYQKEKLVHHVFTREVNSSYIQQAELQQILKDGLEGKRSKLVYFFSKECEHCSMSDVKRVDNVLEELKLRSKYGLQIFDLDHEEMPSSFKIKRTPELVQFCGSQQREFGGIFDIASLKRFITREERTEFIAKFQGNAAPTKVENNKSSQL